MANVFAVKQRRTYKMVNKKKVPTPKPSAANLSHAAAVTKASYWLNDGDNILTSESFSNTREVNAKWNEWKTEAIQRYQKHHKANRKPPKNTTLIEEMMLIIGTDVQAEDYETIIRAYCKHFEQKYNTEVLYWAYHNHEGHLDEEGGEKINRHVHVFFSNIDNNGKSVRRQWGRNELSQMQTDVYEVGKSVGLDIERATKNVGRAPKGKGHRAYREQKRKEAEAERIAKIKDVQAENIKLRAELKEAGADREQYAKLETEIRELKEQAKAKELTVEQLHARIEKLEELAYTGKTKKKRVRNRATGKIRIKEVKETYKEKLEEVELTLDELMQFKSGQEITETAVQELRERNATLTSTVTQKNAQIANLKEKNREKDKKLEEKDKKIEVLEEKVGKLQDKNEKLETALDKASAKLAEWAKFIKERFSLDLFRDEPPEAEPEHPDTTSTITSVLTDEQEQPTSRQTLEH